ncbi:MAG: hypothetical protein COU85_02580 [Candidatus Portnoybacteria bacterium CG10_big_fil_rev_8_21_14_0_10_44_7]|uniref:Glycosyltransferase 2-like domain-containing protein n=1 Tax=Candidatus Portnoybacteria bacterium CG10_big_fil_rev_8_21_14_0_10_44_7 TaxID=1974816 RepID=A0A2M8KI94_9BACT|nr:MAG: hypothetical protein COU85_02580 [Candidatus Portnoybacteria bacterium CG10_big_fil_rev_8_21_14_0_10_44_7]
MKISFIVTNYKTPEMVKLCLRSFKEGLAGFDFSLVLVDCEPARDFGDDFREILPKLKYIKTKTNVGYAYLVNLGLKEIDWGDYVMVMNGDMVVPPGQIKKMVDFMEAHRQIGVLGPQLLYFSQTPQNSCFRFYKPTTVLYRRTPLKKLLSGKKELARFEMHDYDRRSPRKVDWLLGAALLIRKEALQQAGGMDKNYFLFFEDVDWCRSFWEKGFAVVFYPGAVLYHYHGKVSQKRGLLDILVNKYTWAHIRSAIYYFKKWGRQTPHYYQNSQVT